MGKCYHSKDSFENVDIHILLLLNSLHVRSFYLFLNYNRIESYV